MTNMGLTEKNVVQNSKRSGSDQIFATQQWIKDHADERNAETREHAPVSQPFDFQRKYAVVSIPPFGHLKSVQSSIPRSSVRREHSSMV